jgi:hypothetical protein
MHIKYAINQNHYDKTKYYPHLIIKLYIYIIMATSFFWWQGAKNVYYTLSAPTSLFWLKATYEWQLYNIHYLSFPNIYAPKFN